MGLNTARGRRNVLLCGGRDVNSLEGKNSDFRRQKKKSCFELSRHRRLVLCSRRFYIVCVLGGEARGPEGGTGKAGKKAVQKKLTFI